MNEKGGQGRRFERILFQEKPRSNAGLFAVIIVTLVIDDSIIAFLLLHFGIPGEVIYPVVGINVLVIIPIFMYVHLRSIVMTDQRICIRLGISRRCILMSDIRSFSVSDPPLRSRMGLGIFGSRIGKVYWFKTGSHFIKIEHGRGQVRRVFFNVDHFTEFVTLLKDAMGTR